MDQQGLTFVHICTWKLTQINKRYTSENNFDYIYIAVSTQIITSRHTEHC